MTERTSWHARFARALPATRESKIIALNALVGSVGTGMFLAGSALYFTRFAGLTETQLGVGLALAGIVGLATTVPMGLPRTGSAHATSCSSSYCGGPSATSPTSTSTASPSSS